MVWQVEVRNETIAAAAMGGAELSRRDGRLFARIVFVFQHNMIVALSCAWHVSSRWDGSTQRPSGVSWRPSRPVDCGR